MPKIITITANTAIDKITGWVNKGRPNEEPLTVLFPAGKGVNVARTVATLEQEVLALGFVGLEDQNFFQTLNSPNFHVRLIAVNGPTRTNVSVLDRNGRMISYIRNSGFTIADRELEQLISSLTSLVARGDVVVISGSLPLGLEPTVYEHLVRLSREHGATVILDSSNTELEAGLRSAPFMIKPNLAEFESLIKKSNANEKDIIDAAERILMLGVSLVVVSRGSEGIIALSNESPRVWKANVTLDKETALSEGIGSGDALVGGIAVGLLEHRPLMETLRLGVACGAANLLTAGPGQCRIEDIERLAASVTIEPAEVRLASKTN
jgi:1-phosphofructokinase family hexose kinase